jgi:hypothetical protein
MKQSTKLNRLFFPGILSLTVLLVGLVTCNRKSDKGGTSEVVEAGVDPVDRDALPFSDPPFHGKVDSRGTFRITQCIAYSYG